MRKTIGLFKINVKEQINAFKETPLCRIQQLEINVAAVKDEINKIDFDEREI